MKLILASSSPRRRDLLKSIGIDNFEVIPAGLDEIPLKKELPKNLSERLAFEKAWKIFRDQKGLPGFVLGADTVVACGRRIVAAPSSEEEARQCLDLLSGKSHRVYTALCLISPEEKVWRRVVETRVCFKRLEALEKEMYIKSHEGFGKAGGYAIQGIAGSFVKRINGSYTAILGLPLYETRNLLRGAGVISLEDNR
ncbi:MAG: septum formation protein Maf [Proteobacteria bacterium]|nr:septum formation protein Maf [Pseudomonadota bacterium]